MAGASSWSAVAALLLAPCIGSFISAYVARLPEGGAGLIAGRSRCPACRRTLTPLELIPLLSYALQKGRCRSCGEGLSALYPVAEWGALLIAAASFWVLEGPQAWVTAALGWALLALSLADWRHFLLPDAVTLPLIPLGLAVTWWLVPGNAGAVFNHAASAAVVVLALLALRWGYARLRGREGLGLGDVKLCAAAGVWLGPLLLPWLFVAAGGLALGCLVLEALAGRGREVSDALPFGLFLAPAFWGLWLFKLLSG